MKPLTNDFAAFADPGTIVTIADNQITWFQGQKQRVAKTISTAVELPDLEVDGRRYTYQQFFASESMGDLRGLATNIKAVVPSFSAFVADAFVEPDIAVEDDANGVGTTLKASAFFQQYFSTPSKHRTQLLFVKGRAGDGKSTLLLHLTYNQAATMLNGGSTRLLLYVDAQGSVLAKIDEVLGKVIDDFGAKFRYHAISTLTRLGLIVPIIDGFDELLGVAGYKDAFSSLARFIARLDGEGHVVASARSTFYQYTDFGEWAGRLSSDDDPLLFAMTPASICPWQHQQREEYFQKIDKASLLPEMEAALRDHGDEVLSSPFMVSQLADLGANVIETTPAQQLVSAIVERLIDREMRFKVLNKDGAPLLTLEQHKRFLRMVAEEMWWLESREIDETTLFTIAELVAEQLKLPDDVASRFREKVPSYALFVRTESPPRIAFRHEFYFAFFVAQVIRDALQTGKQLDELLSRATLSSVIADEVANAMTATELGRAIGANGTIETAVKSTRAPDTLSANYGAIVAGGIRQHGEDIPSACVVGALVVGADLSGTCLSNFTFERCTFAECNLSSASWNTVDFDNSVVSDLAIDLETRMPNCSINSASNLSGIVVRKPTSLDERLYGAKDLEALAKRVGLNIVVTGSSNQPRVSPEMKGQLEQFLRVAQRTVYFSDEDFTNRGISMNSDLKEVVTLLRKSELLVTASKKPRSGLRAMFRLADTVDNIRQGEAGRFSSEPVKRFWQEMFDAD